ncbi:MAG: hypothetical protein KA715_00995 [Xanthomonadaceae bacterium]|nr:hypothetical protein [Xanthomonadaceae bacterium]
MRNNISLLIVLSALVLESCGQNYAPLQLAAEPAAIPDMTLPIDSSSLVSQFGVGTAFTGFTATTQGFRWQNTVNLAAVNVRAPVTGVVSLVETGLANSTNNVTVYFNARYSIKITGITNLGNVRVGDYVVKGVNSIGSMTYTSSIATIIVIVYQDGTPICPLTFFDSASRASISAQAVWFANSTPCAI